MPWKLLAFIATMTLVLVFVGFNLGNSCDISIVFMTFPQVPVVITILGSFVLGLLAAFFLSLGNARRKGSGKAPRAHASRDLLRAPAKSDVGLSEGAGVGEVLDAPSAGGKKPRARAKKPSQDKRSDLGALDTR